MGKKIVIYLSPHNKYFHFFKNRIPTPEAKLRIVAPAIIIDSYDCMLTISSKHSNRLFHWFHEVQSSKHIKLLPFSPKCNHHTQPALGT